jgi:histidine triad (HIT) family protein
MTKCTFCRIVAGEEPASRVYEDEWALAFMNLRQANPGHVLVIPKAHVATVYDLDDATAARLMPVVARVARALRKAFNPPGLTIWQSNGVASHQEIDHLHIHLLPRQVADGLLRFYSQSVREAPADERDFLASQIAAHIDSPN